MKLTNPLLLLALALLASGPARAAAPGHSYFELRIYDVAAGKMDAVLERFRDTVEPVRRKHGITTVGAWTAPSSTNAGKFIYLLSAASRDELKAREQAFGSDPDFKKGYAASQEKHGKTVDRIESLPLEPGPVLNLDSASAPRVFDLRIYVCAPGKEQAFADRWRNHGAPIYRRHGLPSIGWWTPVEEKDRAKFVCLLAGPGLKEIERSIASFHADPEWLAVEKQTEAGGKLRTSVESFKMTPVDFSRLK